MRHTHLFWPLALMACAAVSAAAHAQDALPVVSSPRMSLAEALTVAAGNSITLKQMQADASVAAAAARGAQAQTRPSLSTTTYGTVGDSSNVLTTSPGVMPQNLFVVAPRPFADQNLMLMVPLLTGGRLRNTATTARKQGEAAELSVEASRLTVAETVTEGYADAALQQALVDVAQARLTAEDEQVRVTQEKVTVGRSAPVDLLREQAEQADARQGLLVARNDAALALIHLKTAMGISQASPVALSDTLDTLSEPGTASAATAAPPATLVQALNLADANRPELAAAQRQVEAAQAAVSAARAAYAPQVYGVAMGDATAGQGIGRAGYTVGLTASLPLYDGGQRRADLDGVQGRLDRARADAQAARQEVDQQVASAWLTLQTATAQLETARAGVAAAQASYNLARLRFDAGKSVAADRLDALFASVRAQGSLARAKAELLIARAKFQAALGVS